MNADDAEADALAAETGRRAMIWPEDDDLMRRCHDLIFRLRTRVAEQAEGLATARKVIERLRNELAVSGDRR